MTITRNAYRDSSDDDREDGPAATPGGTRRGQLPHAFAHLGEDEPGDPFDAALLGDDAFDDDADGDWDDWDEDAPSGPGGDPFAARRAPAHAPLRPTGARAAPIAGPIDTDADVLEQLLALVGDERDGPRALWLILLDPSHRPLPIVVPISDLPTMVDRQLVANLAQVVQALLATHAPGGSVAIALVRRSGGDRGTFEAGWSGALHEGLALVGVRVRAVVAIGRDRARVLPARPA